MASEMKFRRNIERDAILIKAGMNGGMNVPICIGWGWKPDDVEAHGEWLRKQPESYIETVARRVIEMEKD